MNTLKIARIKKHLTQKRLAEKAGLFREAISVIESGKQIPNKATRAKIEKVVGKVNWIETATFKLQTPDWFKAEKLLKKLFEQTLLMPTKERRIFNKLVRKYF